MESEAVVEIATLYLAFGGRDSHFGFLDACRVGDDVMGKKAKSTSFGCAHSVSRARALRAARVRCSGSQNSTFAVSSSASPCPLSIGTMHSELWCSGKRRQTNFVSFICFLSTAVATSVQVPHRRRSLHGRLGHLIPAVLAIEDHTEKDSTKIAGGGILQETQSIFSTQTPLHGQPHNEGLPRNVPVSLSTPLIISVGVHWYVHGPPNLLDMRRGVRETPRTVRDGCRNCSLPVEASGSYLSRGEQVTETLALGKPVVMPKRRVLAIANAC
uniref:Uncharacterized protein n=1 Tax=Salix viminalis TaxID=40686 RepID=A0A6N2L6V3_SALVM